MLNLSAFIIENFKLWSPICIIDEPISNITKVKCIEK